MKDEMSEANCDDPRRISGHQENTPSVAEHEMVFEAGTFVVV